MYIIPWDYQEIFKLVIIIIIPNIPDDITGLGSLTLKNMELLKATLYMMKLHLNEGDQLDTRLVALYITIYTKTEFKIQSSLVILNSVRPRKNFELSQDSRYRE